MGRDAASWSDGMPDVKTSDCQRIVCLIRIAVHNVQSLRSETMSWRIVLITLLMGFTIPGCAAFKPETANRPRLWENIPGTDEEKSDYIREHGGVL